MSCLCSFIYKLDDTYIVLHGKTSHCRCSLGFMSFNLPVCVFMRYCRCLNNVLLMTAIWRTHKEMSPTEQHQGIRNQCHVILHSGILPWTHI